MNTKPTSKATSKATVHRPATDQQPTTYKHNKEHKNKKNVEEIYPDWLDPVLWNDFKDHRKNLKPKLTPKAEELAISKLKSLIDQGYDQKALIEETIERGWKSFFPPNNQNHKHGLTLLERNTAAAAEAKRMLFGNE